MTEKKPQTPEFDEIADLFWRLGVMQSPSRLQGFLAGQIAVANVPTVETWLSQAITFIESVEPPNSDEERLLIDLHRATCFAFIEGDMEFELLLPDDAVEITQRVDSMSQWCKGFLTGFAMAGKEVQQQQGQRQYSKDVSDALSDMGAISQVGLTGDDSEEKQREQDYFEISEYLRLAAINIYFECNQKTGAAAVTLTADSDKAISSPSGLFSNKSEDSNKKLH